MLRQASRKSRFPGLRFWRAGSFWKVFSLVWVNNRQIWVRHGDEDGAFQYIMGHRGSDLSLLLARTQMCPNSRDEDSVGWMFSICNGYDSSWFAMCTRNQASLGLRFTAKRKSWGLLPKGRGAWAQQSGLCDTWAMLVLEFWFRLGVVPSHIDLCTSHCAKGRSIWCGWKLLPRTWAWIIWIPDVEKKN